MVDNYNLEKDILKILLKDRTTNKNIIWGTDDYSQNGIGYYAENHIELRLIEGKYTKIIEPRVLKNKEKQLYKKYKLNEEEIKYIENKIKYAE